MNRSIHLSPWLRVMAGLCLLLWQATLQADDSSKRESTRQKRSTEKARTEKAQTEKPQSLEGATEDDYATAVMAGGCFWCVETDFEKLDGVVDVISGYSGGRSKQPTYANYASGGHREVVFIVYDPQKVTYAGLVEWLIKHVDPTDRGGSFLDRGGQYRSTIYYETDDERAAAERVIKTMDGWRVFRSKINVAIEQRQAFWPAEDYHQDYHSKHGIKYQFFRAQSGRDAFVASHWGTRSSVLEVPGAIPDPLAFDSEESQSAEQAAEPETPHWFKFTKLTPLELRKRLNPIQFHVTQEQGTEPAFQNKYWDHKEAGIYVDILSGAPLFSSADKFDSGTGWPSFTKPMDPQYLVYLEDHHPFMGTRTEVRSSISSIHLGHVFADGPVRAGGKRYCMNSAALRFVPREQMENDGYGEFLKFVPDDQAKP